MCVRVCCVCMCVCVCVCVSIMSECATTKFHYRRPPLVSCNEGVLQIPGHSLN